MNDDESKCSVCYIGKLTSERGPQWPIDDATLCGTRRVRETCPYLSCMRTVISFKCNVLTESSPRAAAVWDTYKLFNRNTICCQNV